MNSYFTRLLKPPDDKFHIFAGSIHIIALHYEEGNEIKDLVVLTPSSVYLL